MNSAGPQEPPNDCSDPSAQSAGQAEQSAPLVADDTIGGLPDNVQEIWPQAAPSDADTRRETSQGLRGNR